MYAGQSKTDPIQEILNSKAFVRYNFIFWGCLGAITYAQDFFAHVVDGAPMGWLDSSLYLFIWLLWALLTPYIVRLTIAFPITKKRLTRRILLHLGFAVIVASALEAAEMLFISSISSALNLKGAQAMMLTYLIYGFHVRMIIYFLIVAVTSALIFFISERESETRAAQLRSELANAQLKALKMQIQPHFLFNTHQSIIGLMLKNDVKKSIQMLSQLSDLLRLTLLISEKQFITLEKEISTISLYLSIQQVRFSDRLQIVFNIPPSLERALVPSFILQPLVENAIQHGFAPHASAGAIEIRATKSDEHIIISVKDDGMGLREPSPSSRGIGISNVVSRLQELYGHDHFSFTLENDQVKGAVATLQLPFVEDEEFAAENKRIPSLQND